MATELPDTTAPGEPSQRSVRKVDIEEAAITLFDERGYHGTRMQDIAKKLGIQAPSLYNHVASKQQILRELMLGRMRALLHEHELAHKSASDVGEQLRRLMEAHVRHCARYRRETRIGNREVHSLEEPARTELLEMRTQLSGNLTELIERGVAVGRFDVETPQLAAYSLLQMGVGVAMWVRPLAIPESQLVYALGDAALRIVADSKR